MVLHQKTTGRASSIPAGLAAGITVSFLITLFGVILTAKLIEEEIFKEDYVGYAVMVILITASFAGAIISRNRIKRQYLIVCGLSGILYFLMLLSITALFFGGQYEAVGVTGILIFGGSMLPLLIQNRKKTSDKRRKIRLPNR